MAPSAGGGLILSVGIGISTTLGAAIGAIGSALVTARSRRPAGEGALVTAASELTDRLLRRNDELALKNRQARQALAKLISAVQTAQDIFERFPEVGDGDNNRRMMDTLQTALDIANALEI